jgi:hypothetical protein
MHEQQEAAFWLDVMKHVSHELQALREARDALKLGGYLFVITRAFTQLWRYRYKIEYQLR